MDPVLKFKKMKTVDNGDKRGGRSHTFSGSVFVKDLGNRFLVLHIIFIFCFLQT